MLQHGDDWAKGLAAGKYEVLERHLDMVLSANQCLNLTAIEDRAEARRLHIADSLSAVPELNKAPEGTFVDLGSGAGYPGIPLAVASGRKAILLESRKKRSAFLREIVESLKLSAEVIALRAEEVAKTRHGEFAAVITRAAGRTGCGGSCSRDSGAFAILPASLRACRRRRAEMHSRL